MKADFKLQNSFAFWIHRLNNLLQEQFNQALKEYELTWPQWMLLNALSDDGINTPAAIAEQLGVDRSGITRLLDRLETKEYVEREHDKLDRRSVKLHITSKGKKLMSTINSLAYQHQEKFLEELHLSERRGFKKELQKMLKTCGVDSQATWQRID
ncbi:MAG: MarR family winged helix-turn-helix transcriptional regulator [Cellvibrionaceae bacterium]